MISFNMFNLPQSYMKFVELFTDQIKMSRVNASKRRRGEKRVTIIYGREIKCCANTSLL